MSETAMRIALYAPIDFSTAGGMQSMMVCLARCFRHMGHQADIIAEPSAAVADVSFVSPRRFAPRDYDVVNTQHHCALWSATARRETALVHTYGNTTLGLRLATRRARSLLNPHNWRGVVNEGVAGHLSHRVIAVSQLTLRDVVRYCRVPPSKVTVVHNGQWVSSSPTPPDARQRWRSRLGIGEETVVFLFVGRDDDTVKAAWRAVGALRRLRAQGLPVALVMVPGTRDYGGDVLRTGALNPAQLNALYRAADVYVNCSLSEGFSLALAEALAAGLPCLCTAVGGAPEVIRDGWNGRLVDGTVTALTRAMTELATSPHLRAQWGENARRSGAALSWERTAEQTLAVFEQARHERRLCGQAV